MIDKTKANSFTDTEGRQWCVRITNRTIRDVKARLSIDLRELLNEECRPLMALLSDSLQLAQVLYIACADEVQASEVSESDFLDAIYGDVTETAGEAFCTAFVDFFPNPQLRQAISQMLGLTRKLKNEIATAASERVSNAIESMDASAIANSIVSPESSA